MKKCFFQNFEKGNLTIYNKKMDTISAFKISFKNKVYFNILHVTQNEIALELFFFSLKLYIEYLKIGWIPFIDYIEEGC